MLSFLFGYTPLKFYIQSFWRDEAFTYLLAKQNIIQILITTARDANPPLYYLIVHAWMIVFGHSEFAIRTLSFLFFLGTLYVVGMFLLDVFGFSIKRTMVYMLLFVANPVLHYYAFEARMYTLFAFTTSLSFYYLYKRDFKKYMIVSVISLYTHYFTFFVLLGQVLYLLLTNNRQNLKKIIVLYSNISVFFIPWVLIVLLSKPTATGEFWIQKLQVSTLFNLPAILLTGYEQSQWFIYPVLPIFSIFLYGVGAFFAYRFFKTVKQNALLRIDHRKHEHIALLIFCWVIPPIAAILLVSFFRPIFLPRYMIFATVGLLLGVLYLIKSLKPHYMYVLFAILLIFSLHYGSLQIIKRGKADIKTPLLEIKNAMGEQDVVYVTHEFNFHPAQYYINDSQVYLYSKPYDKVPWYVGKVLFPEEKVTNTLPVYPRKAFILRDDLTYSVQALY